MALILNIETATTVCSVSLGRDGRMIALKEINGDYTHAENLTLFIEDVLKQSGNHLSELDAVAVSKGPGSYTGLRIGVSTAKGLCYSLNKPLIAINTLQHMALSVSGNFGSEISNQQSLICPMIDARRMEVYCALFDVKNNFISPTAAVIVDEFSFAAELEKHSITFFGDGSAKCKAVLAGNKNAFFLENIVPSAANMASLAEQAFVESRFEDVAYFEPFYLKDFVAGKKKAESSDS